MHTIGYIALLRRNRPFRRLWYGQVVSQLGDWLDSIALFTLMLNLTGSGRAVGLLLVAEFLPATLVGPFAGVIVDRLPRKLVLIASDLGRALLVLCLLFVREASELWLVYAVVISKVALSAFFEPARSAIMPSLCQREELIAANGLGGATWSAVLALGAALGGLVAGTLGVQAAFVLDACSFLLSAALIATVQVPIGSEHGDKTAERASAWTELREGWSYIVGHPDMRWYTFAKALWSIGGGILLLLTLFGREIFPLGRDGALSIGLLYTARGLGAGIGPLIAQRLGGEGQVFMRRAIGFAFFLTAAGYFALGQSPILWVGMLAVMLAHMGGSMQWVYSSALIQLTAPNRLMGRVFAIEYAAMMLTTALSSYVVGLAHDAGMAPRPLAASLALVFIGPGLLLSGVLWRVQSGEPGTAN